jgi:phospho-N-acetylmuramoyl-pentapeptide-transferase
MLLYLFDSLSGHLALRAFLAAFTALVIGFALGPWTIRRLHELHFGQAVRDDGPKTHLKKQGTPTMGGALILFAMTVAVLLFADLSNRFVWAVMIVTIGCGCIGWNDDYRKVVHHNPRGMPAREKFAWQSVLGLLGVFYLAFALSVPEGGTLTETIAQWVADGFPLQISDKIDLTVPFLGHWAFPGGVIGYLIFTYIVVTGSSNAINLTDGLDGLAIFPSALVGVALGIFAYVSGSGSLAAAASVPHIPGAGEMLVIGGALAGAGLAFLWFNAHPAQVFMGDVGSLAIGACLGMMSIVCRQELLFAVMGGVFVMETVSVMIQTTYFRFTHGKRVFLMTPIHHHFELKGWPETQVVTRFWIISIVLTLIGLSTLAMH